MLFPVLVLLAGILAIQENEVFFGFNLFLTEETEQEFNMNNELLISGYVFAGGKSRRMGTDKALLTIEKQPILLRMIKLIEPFCENVAISGQNADYSTFNIEMISDVYSGIGPISGIYSCLNQTANDWNLLISVDVPFVNREMIQYLLSNRDKSDAIIPKHASGVEPLVGLYHKSIFPVVEEMILKGDYKLMNLLAKLNTKYLDCFEILNEYPRLFHNLNSPDDFQAI